jgi:hypothetical protein
MNPVVCKKKRGRRESTTPPSPLPKQAVSILLTSLTRDRYAEIAIDQVVGESGDIESSVAVTCVQAIPVRLSVCALPSSRWLHRRAPGAVGHVRRLVRACE